MHYGDQFIRLRFPSSDAEQRSIEKGTRFLLVHSKLGEYAHGDTCSRMSFFGSRIEFVCSPKKNELSSQIHKFFVSGKILFFAAANAYDLVVANTDQRLPQHQRSV